MNSVTGIITGAVNGSAGDGRSHWQQEAAVPDAPWRLQYADGTYAAGELLVDEAGNVYEQVAWELINGAWYAFGADAGAKEGWVYDARTAWMYYIDILTRMKTGWVMVNGFWYYLNPDATGKAGRPLGAMYRNEMTPDGYSVGADGCWEGAAS